MSRLESLLAWTPFLLGGLAWNILIATVAMGAGTLLGCVLAWMRLCDRPWLRRIGTGLTELSRNVPTIVFQFYLALMLPGEALPAWLKAAFALAVAVLGFTSDNLLIALREWRRGQRAAAMLFLPSWCGYLLIIVLASSTASIIGVGELVSRCNSVINASADSGLMVPMYLWASLIFFAFCWPLVVVLEHVRAALARRYSP